MILMGFSDRRLLSGTPEVLPSLRLGACCDHHLQRSIFIEQQPVARGCWRTRLPAPLNWQPSLLPVSGGQVVEISGPEANRFKQRGKLALKRSREIPRQDGTSPGRHSLFVTPG